MNLLQPLFLRDKVYTDKVSYKIDVVETEYDSFIEFLNRNTASQYDLEKIHLSNYLLILKQIIKLQKPANA